jgi:hypothetical protein
VDDVEKALSQMGLRKALGVDDFTMGFFQKLWPLVKDKVLVAVLGFLNGGACRR